MNKTNMIYLASILLLFYSIKAQFDLDTKNLKYFECEDLLINNALIQNKLEKQNIHSILNTNTKNYSNVINYIFNNTRSDENSNARTGLSKSQNFLKYKNFTLEKNFQIMIRIKKNPEFINNENTEKLNLEKMQKNGFYVWLMRNNKFSFENIRKNIEFNGLAFKIGEAEIKIITSNKEKNNIIKPFFDSNNDYKSLTNQKIVSSDLREETIKITMIKNYIFVEGFSNDRQIWEVVYFEKMTFFTIENFGVNLEMFSDIKDNNEAYLIEYLTICPIKSLNYEDNLNMNYNNNNTNFISGAYSNKEKNKANEQNIEEGEIKEFKYYLESLQLSESFNDKAINEKFISNLFSLFVLNSNLVEYFKTNNIENKTILFHNESLVRLKKQTDLNKDSFEQMHTLVIELLNIIKYSISNSNAKKESNNIDEAKSDEKAFKYEELMNLINLVDDEIASIRKNKKDEKILQNFILMKNNFDRIDKNLKLIISDCDKEIKSILSNIINKNEDNILIDLLDYLFLLILFSMIVLLYLIYRYVNLLMETPKDYINLSRDINNIEKNNNLS